MDEPVAQDSFLSKKGIMDIEDARFLVHTMEGEGAWQGKTVRLRTIQADERDIFESRCFLSSERDEPFGMRANLVAKCLVDADGARLFSETEIHLLGAKSGAALDELFHVCKKLNAMNIGQMEELAKKSEGPSDSN